MRKYVLALLAFVMMMMPSVAYADTADVTMMEVTESEPSIIDTMTEEMIMAKNAELEKVFAEKHPELYEAYKKTMDTPYAFDMNMNMIMNIDYPETEEMQVMDLRRVFAQMSMNGYINMPVEEMDMTMDIKLDAGEMMQQTFEGLKIVMKDNMMYVYNPMYDMWETEDLESADLFPTGNPMEQQNIGLMAPFADLMTKRETADSTIYSLKITGDDIQAIVDEYVGMPVYAELMEELEASGMSFEIPEIETIYVVQDGVIRVQHTELDMNVMAEGMTMKFVIALDGQYYSYGLQKEVVVPEIEVPVAEDIIME